MLHAFLFFGKKACRQECAAEGTHSFQSPSRLLLRGLLSPNNFRHGLPKAFKEFIAKGNVVDLAVGVVIGAAFGKIVTSLVEDIIMPPVGLLLSGVNFTDLKIVRKEAHPDPDAAGKIVEALTLNWGQFLQNALGFLIVALAVFLFVVKPVNLLKRRQETAPALTAPPSREEILLTEIRDALRK